MRRLVLIFVWALASLAGCVRNPVTGKPQVSLVSEAQEIQMGKEASEDVTSSVGLYKDSRLASYVSRLGDRLAQSSERPRLPWSFSVLDDAAVNAFALPGGQIFVTRGILTYLTSEAELAAVLGHEIGHVSAKHAVTQLSRAELAQLGVGLGSIFVPEVAQFGGAINAGLSLLFMQYGRDAENEADQLGFRYSLMQGFDVRAMVDLFDMLGSVDQSKGGRLPEWLSTHPSPENRKARIEERLAGLQNVDVRKLVLGRDSYLKTIDGVMFGPDERRNGYFRESTFIHPALQLRVTFPAGWKLENRPRSVLAVSPDEDAGIKLAATSERVAPEQAMATFLEKTGATVRPGPDRGGPPLSVTRYFTLTQRDQEISGLVSFILFRDQTYQFLAVTTRDGNAEERYDDLFATSLASFGRVTDPDLLEVKPEVVQVMSLPDTMTVRQFAERFPSTIPVETLAVINGEEGPDAVLHAGQLVKRVVRNPRGGL